MIRVRVLGALAVEVDGAPAELPSSAKVRGVLGWLALHPGPQPRATAAARLWPDVLDSSARASLRSAIWALRRALGDEDGRILFATRDSVGLAATDVWVDLHELERLRAAGDAEAALVLDAGELLADIDEEWVFAARDEHEQRRHALLAAAAAAAEARGDLDAAIARDRRRIALDPLSEPAHRDLMRRLAAAGDRPAALRTYARLRERMRRELTLSPSDETRAAMEAVRGAGPPEPDGDAQGGPTAAGPRPRAARGAEPAPLVGRDAELETLRAAWERAEAGQGGAVLISGEGGIGKTRLARELLAEAAGQGALVARCAALDLGGASAFGLWAELLGELARAAPTAWPPPDTPWLADVARLAPALAPAASAAPVPAGSPELERARMYEGVGALLAWAAGRQPVLLLMEDVHLADTPSLELTAYVGRRLPEHRMLLVITRRDQPRRAEADALRWALAARDALHAELSLEPLDAAALDALVRAIAPLPPEIVEQVVRASDGNALLAIEAARAAARRHDHPAGAGLAALVRAGVGRQPPGARHVTELAAVAARPLGRGELRAAGAAPADTAEALESGLLESRDGRIGFRHQLLRDAAYGDLAEPRRAELHELLAETLDGPPAQIARHLRLAGRDEDAVPHLAQAAADASAMAAFTEAAAFLREAIEIHPDDAELLLELAHVEAWRANLEPSDEAFTRALDALEPDDHIARARALARRGLWLRTSLCAPPRAALAYREALAVLEQAGGPEDLLIEVLAGLAWAEGAAGDPAEAEELLRRIHAITTPPLPDRLAATVNSARGIALCRSGRFAECYGPFVAAGDAHVRAGMLDQAAVALGNAACAAAAEGELERALGYADRTVELARGVPYFEMHGHAARAYVLSRLGRHEEARAAAEAQLAIAQRQASEELIATAEHDLGQIALAAGDQEEAVTRIAAGLEHGRALPRARARLVLAETLARLGRPEQAAAELRAATLEPVRAADLPTALVPQLARVQGLVALARGDKDEARRRLDEAAEGWRARMRDGVREVYRVDLGRPPVAGLVEPARELAAVERDLAALATVPA